jgi:hypothetical protein
MSSDTDGWGFSSFTKVLRFLKKDEVKTPLSFLFKIVPYLILLLPVILYAPISDDLKVFFVKLTFLSLIGLAAIVLVFGWFRPKNLVYDETGHRAEYKMEVGTIDRANQSQSAYIDRTYRTEVLDYYGVQHFG